MIILDYIGNDLALYMRQSYDLCRHYYVIGAVAGIYHADIFAAVMKDGCYTKEKALTASESMILLRAVEDA